MKSPFHPFSPSTTGCSLSPPYPLRRNKFESTTGGTRRERRREEGWKKGSLSGKGEGREKGPAKASGHLSTRVTQGGEKHNVQYYFS